MITFQKETYTSLFNDVNFLELISENFQETGVLNDSFKLTPKWKMYKIMAMRNLLPLYSVREEGALVGFFIAFLVPHQHYKNLMVAETDSFFLSKEKRAGLLGYNFLKYAVDALKQEVDLIFFTTNIKRDLSGILTRLNFKLTDYKYLLEV